MDSLVASDHVSSFPDHSHQRRHPSPSANRPSSVPPSLPSAVNGPFKPPSYSPQQTTSSSSDHSADSTTFERMLNPSVFFQNIRSSRRQKYDPVLSKSPRPEHMVRMMTLHQAARDGQLDIVQQHINSIGKDKKKVNRKDQENTTPLHYAVRYGHFKIVKLLVANGANVNVQGECGATPLHYAARYVTKPLKTPQPSPSGTPAPSPLTRNKNNRTLRQIIAQRKFSQAICKKDVLQKKKAFQRSFRNFMDLTVGKSPRKDAVPLNRLQRTNTIHESLERIENGRLTTAATERDPRPQSNLELANIFDSPKLDRPKSPSDVRRQDSFEYGYAENNRLDPPSEKPIVIIGHLSMEDMGDVQSVDAIILPEVRNLSPSLSPSISLPDIAAAVQTQGVEKLTQNQQGESVERNLIADTLTPNLTPSPVPRSLGNSCEKLAKESILLYLLEQKANVNAKDLYMCTPLHYAAMRGNESAVFQLLTVKNIDIEAKDRTQMTALHTAASVGSVQVCRLLLDRGCDIRCLDEEDMTPLHFAAMEGHIEVLKLLFQRAEDTGGYMMLGKMIMDQDRDEQTALHLAVENGHTDIVNLLIDKGANVNFVKTNLITPLHLACRSGQLDIIRILVESEADIEAKNALQETPLHRAALFNRRDVVDYLLNRNADINCRDKDQETPLMMSVRKNNVDTVKLLLDRNADVGVADSKDKTCLYVAAEENCVDTFELLIQVPKLKLLMEEFNKNENTPLHIAAMKGHIEIVQILLKHGACIDAKNDQNLTPLHLAAQHGKSRIVEMLLNKNYNIVNDEDDASNTPLHLAALEGHVKVVAILLQCGAAVDARNAMLWTPLDSAASRGWTWCAERLLDADSIVDPTDKAKTTPLHLASREGHVDMIKLLLARNADITRKDHLGRNCLDCAIDNNQRGSAMAILDSENWESALKNCTVEGNKILTPMRKLIKKLPDVAEKVFDKCIRGNGLPKEHPQYEITCVYEFLEDTFADWGPTHRYHDNNMYLKQYQYGGTLTVDPRRDQPSPTPVAKIGDKIGDKLLFPGYAKKQSEIKGNHPLKYMVQSERTKLLSHPLVTYLLRHKWRTFGRWFYYSKLLVYAIHLIFLTAYALTIIADEYEFTYHIDNLTLEKVLMCMKKNKTEYYHSPSESTRKFFVDFGKYVVLILAVLSILVEIGKMLTELQNYFHIHCVLEIVAYIVSIMYVMVSFTWSDGTPVELIKHSRCNSVDRNLGAIAVWISWINLVLVLRKFPKIGIYVVMFTDILKTFGQFFVVFMLFITAFGLGFHMLLYHQKPIAYQTPARAILKTTMGMLGEFEYDSIFNETYYPVTMAWAIYIAYLVINCIILMNLLVGLAVDDIKGVQEQAGLKRLAMQVDLTLDVEKALPLSVQRSYIKMEETILPNEERSWNLGSFWTIKSPVSASSGNDTENLDVMKKQQDELRDSVRALKHKLNQLETQNNRMEAMLTSLLRQSESNGCNIDHSQERY